MARFDPTINYGHLLTAIVMVVSVSLAWADVQAAINVHETRISALEESLRESRLAQQRIFDTLTVIREDVAAIKARQ